MTVENAKKEDDEQEEEDDPVRTLIVTAGLQYVSELRNVLSTLVHSDEMLNKANKTDNFFSSMHIQNLKQTKMDTFCLRTSETKQNLVRTFYYYYFIL